MSTLTKTFFRCGACLSDTGITIRKPTLSKASISTEICRVCKSESMIKVKLQKGKTCQVTVLGITPTKLGREMYDKIIAEKINEKPGSV